MHIYFLKGQLHGHTGEETVLTFEDFPHVGLSKVAYLIWYTYVDGISNLIGQ